MHSRNLLRQCLVYSAQSLTAHPQYRHYIHYSFGIVDGKIAVVGKNHAALPDVHFGYHARVTEPKIHAELDAYKRLRKKYPISKTAWSLVNVRINRSGEFKLSKPCDVCTEWLTAVGCHGWSYTTEVGWQHHSLT